MQYIAAMGHPTGGRNDVPNRLKFKLLVFNVVVPSTVSVDNIYGSILLVRFDQKSGAAPGVIALARRLTGATIALWHRVSRTMLPTPSRFHFVFNLRELSRISKA